MYRFFCQGYTADKKPYLCIDSTIFCYFGLLLEEADNTAYVANLNISQLINKVVLTKF